MGLYLTWRIDHDKTNHQKVTLRSSLFSGLTIETSESIIDDLLTGGCNQIIYFTDYDTIVNHNKQTEFERLKTKYSGYAEVLICETMPSIEYWFLLHYQKTTREFSNTDEACRFLKKHLKDYSKKEYYLRGPKWVETLCADGKLETDPIAVLIKTGTSYFEMVPVTIN